MAFDFTGFMVVPNSRFFIIWRLIALLFLLYTLVSFPLSLSFVQRGAGQQSTFVIALIVTNTVVDVFFILDLFLKVRRWIPQQLWKDSERLRFPHEITGEYFSMFKINMDPMLNWRGKLTVYLDSPGVVLGMTPIVLMGVLALLTLLALLSLLTLFTLLTLLALFTLLALLTP
jgi:hypothetical protein